MLSPLDLQKFCIFDLEYTCWEGSQERAWSNDGEFREVVCIGAVEVCHNENELYETNHLLRLIKPKINPELSVYFQRLTGISNQNVQLQGSDYISGIQSLIEFSQGIPCFCYGTDGFVLVENLHLCQMAYSCKLLSNTEVELSLSKDMKFDAIVSPETARKVYVYSQIDARKMEDLAEQGLVISLDSSFDNHIYNSLKVVNIRSWIHQLLPSATGRSSGELAGLLGLSVGMDSNIHNPLYDVRSLLIALQHIRRKLM